MGEQRARGAAFSVAAGAAIGLGAAEQQAFPGALVLSTQGASGGASNFKPNPTGPPFGAAHPNFGIRQGTA
jgi:hypothetical protein